MPGVLAPDPEAQALEDAWVLRFFKEERKCSALEDSDGGIIQANERGLKVKHVFSSWRATAKTCPEPAVAVVNGYTGQWYCCAAHLEALGGMEKVNGIPMLEWWRKVWLATDEDLEDEQRRLRDHFPDVFAEMP